MLTSTTPQTRPEPLAAAGVPRSASSVVYLDLLRIVAMFAVVCTHVSGPYALLRMPAVSRENWLVGLGFFYWSLFGVPLFLMISGALVLRPDSRESAGQFYRRKLPRILIPFVLWKLIYYYVLVYPADFNAAAIVKFMLVSNYTFWFMYMITAVYLAAPFLSRMAKAGGMGLLIGFAAISFAVHLAGVWFRANPGLPNGFSNYDGFFSGFYGYFLLGFVLRHVELPRRLQRPWLFAALAAVPVVFTVAVTAWKIPQAPKPPNPLLDIQLPTTAMMTICLFIAFRLWFPEGCGSVRLQRALRTIGSAGLGVYLLHSLLLIRLIPLLKSIWPGIMDHPALFIPIMTVLAYVTSLLIIVPLGKLPVTRHLT